MLIKRKFRVNVYTQQINIVASLQNFIAIFGMLLVNSGWKVLIMHFNKDNILSQQHGIIFLIPKENKYGEYLTNWRPVSLLNVDYKIVTKTIALRLEKILSNIIHPCQSGYVKGTFIGESIRLIPDTMDFTKIKNITGIVACEKSRPSLLPAQVAVCKKDVQFTPKIPY